MTSTDMLNKIVDKIDFLSLDGRINQEDIKILSNLLHSKSIIVLDDFEGMEKGVINLISIRKSQKFKKYFLIYPPPNDILNKINFFSEACPISLLLPASLVEFVNQG